MDKISYLKAFLENFKFYTKSLEKNKFEYDRSMINSLLSGWRALDSIITKHERENAPNYNIFYILKNIYNNEVITHSPLIADLLNVNGEHRQGDLFYTEFINLLCLTDKEKFLVNDNSFFTIEEPKYIGPIDKEYKDGGFIDILIKYRDSKKHFTIAIENKRDAIDQPRQLERYYNYLSKVYKENILLIYLSPYGNPSENSIKKDIIEKLLKQNVIKIIDYNLIKELLQNTHPKIEAQNVSLLINQYLQII